MHVNDILFVGFLQGSYFSEPYLTPPVIFDWRMVEG